VSQQPTFLVFCFEGQKVPYPASSFLPDIKLSWRKSGRVGSDKTVLSSSDSFVVQGDTKNGHHLNLNNF